MSDMYNAFGLKLEEITSLSRSANDLLFDKLSAQQRRTLCLRLHDQGREIVESLYRLHNTFSAVSVSQTILMAKEAVEGKRELFDIISWDALLSRVFSHPVAMRDRAVWGLYMAAIEAQRDFAHSFCPAPTREDGLSGSFRTTLFSSARRWGDLMQTVLNRVDACLEVDAIDLSVLGGEQETGGDFALIVDINQHALCREDEQAEILRNGLFTRSKFALPLIFQAKRYTGDQAEVDQYNDRRGYQYDALRRTDCASAYIFYNNGTKRIDAPLLPLVKRVDDIAHPGDHGRTDVLEGSVDFATYLIRAIDNAKYPAASDPEEAINMVLANADMGRLTKLVVLANRPGVAASYRHSLDNLIRDIGLVDQPQEEGPKY
jgi:hypothetical protein